MSDIKPWTREGIDLPAGDLFPDTEEFTAAARVALSACNGFLYHGDSIEAQVRLIKYLRAHPDEARFLVGLDG